MPFRVGDVTIGAPALLAPMAGITDLPFRRLVARFGAGLVVSEMVASREVVEANRAARAKAAVDLAPDLVSDDEIHGDREAHAVPAAVQIAGREARWMGEAAKLVADRGARIVDINMGCPAKKVTSGWSGSALMREPDHALRLIEAVVAASPVPVTLKMRLGWDETCLNAPEIAKRAEEAGVAMITIHGRTRAQFYKGRADWAAIREVKAAVRVPVVANGDVTDAATARRALALSGADAVMIGRGAQGAPWIPAAVSAGVEGRAFRPPTLSERRDLLLEHYDAMLAFHGFGPGLRIARKHLVWALERVPGAEALRARLVRLDAPEAVTAALREGFARLIEGGPAPARQAA